eukprot:8931173-Pyramimonas_sp.AAC.1
MSVVLRANGVVGRNYAEVTACTHFPKGFPVGISTFGGVVVLTVGRLLQVTPSIRFRFTFEVAIHVLPDRNRSHAP